ncbi:MAG: ankyrin repeat domain-containing protein [Candidatus Azobacteroides sp.]|nr:ankyrin repeat domain-containing protein [Candidatus Azobacteroides sp.]
MRKIAIILSFYVWTVSVAAREIESKHEKSLVKDMDTIQINDTVYDDDNSFSRINLMNAAWEGDLNAVKQAAAAGADMNFSDENGNTLLMGAASSGNNELVKFLLSKGANFKAASPSGETALHYAAWKGNMEMTQTLVEAGADVNAFYRANGGLTPLNCAVESGSLETVKYLVSKGADIDYENPDSGSSPLRSAAYAGDFEIFKFIADQKKKIDWQKTLSYAVTGGNLDIVKYIVEEKKANPKGYSDYFNSTLIQRAAERKFNSHEGQDVSMIKYLLSKGAKLKDINNGEIFPWAMENCSDDVINFFLENGVKFDESTDSYGWPPLPAALDNNNFGLAKSLLNDKNPSFRGTPLIVYFSDGLDNSYDIVSFLIKNGVNKDSYSPAFLNSIAYGDLKTAQLLLDAGADINAVNEQGYNALFFTDDYETAKFLISKGIKTDNKKLPAYALTRFNLLRALDENKINIPVSPAEAGEGLLQAAQYGKDWATKYFLSKGADVNYKLKPRAEEKDDARGGMTPLILNAYAGFDKPSYDEANRIPTQTAEILIQAGADINAKDKTGKTALHYAAGGQYYYVMIGPIPMGSRRDRENGAHGDPAAPPAQNHSAIAELLIKSGADMNIKDDDGNTPLLLSAINRNYDAMKILLKAGAKTDIKNNEDKTLFDYLDEEEGFKTVTEAGFGGKISKEAINNAFVKIIEEYESRYRYDKDELARIIALGADVNTPIGGKNALVYILYRNHNLPGKYDFFKQLIASGVDVNAKDEDGTGVLAFTVYKKADLPLIKLLIDSGARVNDVDDSHISALTIANISDYKEAAEILKKAGAKRDITAEWWFALYERWRYDDFTAKLKTLIDEGADINAQTTYAVHPSFFQRI